MERLRPTGAQALDRAFSLLSRIAEDCGASTVAAIAGADGLPLSTAHRMIGRMEACGLLVRVGRGRYRAGLAFARLARHADLREMAAAAARPLLRTLAIGTGRTAHLGLLEADMVTYLVKEAPARTAMFTREAMQLEAYCSAIGKVLLAGLPPGDREAYLRQDGFVALTPRTIVQPDALRAHLAVVADDGHAIDEEEIAPGLYCLAVPVSVPAPMPALAISVAGTPPSPEARAGSLAALREVAKSLSDRLGGRSRPSPETMERAAVKRAAVPF